MTKSVASPVFVDTNVLVYWQDTSDPVKQARAEDWITLLARHRSARTSAQVLVELYSTLTRKLPGFGAEKAQRIVRGVAAWRPVPRDLAVIERAWHLEERYALSWWDSLIVAAAQASDCRFLLTEDLQHDQSFDGVRVINPFRSPDRTPSAVLEELP
ncbi:MAG: PIN domain-containing protein [Acidobacteriota bacterium]|nr:PIN domain-containing protein [Acidobacteriota bacterium]MXW70179.1 PIN domain-containing protein [Acidobacteriota bacterium]MYE42444.1 PIN domain-containing protein [Acidobacteriota bacterium]